MARQSVESERGGPYEERCLRCGTVMSWVHGTFQCPHCRFKIGCCEGPTAECEAR